MPMSWHLSYSTKGSHRQSMHLTFQKFISWYTPNMHRFVSNWQTKRTGSPDSFQIKLRNIWLIPLRT